MTANAGPVVIDAAPLLQLVEHTILGANDPGPEEADAVVAAVLAIDRAHGPQTAAEVLVDLRRWCGSEWTDALQGAFTRITGKAGAPTG